MSATAKLKTIDSSLTKLADEIGDLDRELLPHKAKFTRLESLRKQLRSRYETQPANQEFTVDGQRFVVVVGVRGNQSSIDLARLYKTIGAKQYVEISTVTLGALTELQRPECDALVTIEQTGPRSLSIQAKGVAV